MSRHKPLLAASLALLFVLSMTSPASASPGAHGEAYGSTAGDPRVFEDGKACFDALLASGAADRGSTCDVLYAHIFDLLQWVPVNVQRPSSEFYQDLAQGFPGVPVGHEEYHNLNELMLNSSPGFVEYLEPGTDPRIHPERGITADVVFDPDVPITGYWYLSADFDEIATVDDIPPGSGMGPDAGILPCLTVRMVLQTGQYAFKGTDLAAGSTTKTIVSAKAAEEPGESLAETECPGAGPGDIMTPENVTEFEVTLDPLSDPVVIPRGEGFVVRVEWYQFAPGNPDDQNKVYQGQINVHTGVEHLARVLMPIQNALVIEKVDPVSFDDKIYVQVQANSPWGSYDVDPASLALTLRDPLGNEIPMQHEPPLLRYSVDHGGHFEPVIAVFEWDAKAQNLAPGSYTIEATAKNWQHSATATASTPMEVEGKRIIIRGPDEVPEVPAEESPLAATGLLLTALLGLAMAMRRRDP